MAWARNESITLGSSGDTIDTGTTNYISKKFNTFMFHIIDTGGTITGDTEFNSTGGSGTKYVERNSNDDGAEQTSVNRPDIETSAGGNESADKFTIGYYVNIDGEEKLLISHGVTEVASGELTAPARREIVGKFVETSDAVITSQQTTNPAIGSFDTGSNLSCLGTD